MKEFIKGLTINDFKLQKRLLPWVLNFFNFLGLDRYSQVRRKMLQPTVKFPSRSSGSGNGLRKKKVSFSSSPRASSPSAEEGTLTTIPVAQVCYATDIATTKLTHVRLFEKPRQRRRQSLQRASLEPKRFSRRLPHCGSLYTLLRRCLLFHWGSLASTLA